MYCFIGYSSFPSGNALKFCLGFIINNFMSLSFYVLPCVLFSSVCLGTPIVFILWEANVQIVLVSSVGDKIAL